MDVASSRAAPIFGVAPMPEIATVASTRDVPIAGTAATPEIANVASMLTAPIDEDAAMPIRLMNSTATSSFILLAGVSPQVRRVDSVSKSKVVHTIRIKRKIASIENAIRSQRGVVARRRSGVDTNDLAATALHGPTHI